MTPEYIANLLKPMSETHSLNLRSAVNGTLCVPRARTELYNDTLCLIATQWDKFVTIPSKLGLSKFKRSSKYLEAELRT